MVRDTGRGPIRLTIVDDNPFLRGPGGAVHPRAATFHRFAEAVVRAGPFGRARYLVPVREPRSTETIHQGATVDDAFLEVIPTAPFSGAADYLARLPRMWAGNLPLMARALRDEHLVWIKLPGSNGPLAALCCTALGVARFSYVVGSVRAVVSASERTGRERFAASAAAMLHDGSTSLINRTGPSIQLGAGMFTSAFESADLAGLPGRRRAGSRGGGGRSGSRPGGGPVRLMWAGRVAPEKDLGLALEALGLLIALNRNVSLDILGDGPERPRLEAQCRVLGVAEYVHWRGHITDRSAYLAALAEGDLFVLPSRTEGIPKALVEAMAVGVPAVAAAVGGVPEIARDGRLKLINPGSSIRLANAVSELLDAPREMAAMGERGMAWARDHTAEAQAERLVRWMEEAFPRLPWAGGGLAA